MFRRHKYTYMLTRRAFAEEEVRKLGLRKVNDLEYVMRGWAAAVLDPGYVFGEITVNKVPATLTVETIGSNDTHTHFRLTVGADSVGYETIEVSLENTRLTEAARRRAEMEDQ